MIDASTRQAVAVAAQSWLGTPYHDCARIKGVGVDCAMLPAAVFEQLGLIPHIDPEYPPQWFLHRGEELYLQWLLELGAVQLAEPQVGDLGVWRFGRTFSHGGIVVDLNPIRVVHAYVGLGVVQTSVHEAPLHGRPVQWWGL